MNRRQMAGEHSGQSASMLAYGLGVFSIGLGLAELLAPRTLAKTLGMEGQETLLKAYGAREIGTGIGILASSDPRPWIKARIAGDALDLVTLSAFMGRSNPKRRNVAIAAGAVAGVTALDLNCTKSLKQQERQLRLQKWDYRDRSGWSKPVEAMRGIARDSGMPRDMQAPRGMQPYQRGESLTH